MIIVIRVTVSATRPRPRPSSTILAPGSPAVPRSPRSEPGAARCYIVSCCHCLVSCCYCHRQKVDAFGSVPFTAGGGGRDQTSAVDMFGATPFTDYDAFGAKPFNRAAV